MMEGKSERKGSHGDRVWEFEKKSGQIGIKERKSIRIDLQLGRVEDGGD